MIFAFVWGAFSGALLVSYAWRNKVRTLKKALYGPAYEKTVAIVLPTPSRATKVVRPKAETQRPPWP